MELSITKSKHNLTSIIRALFFLLFISSFVTWLFVGNDLFVSIQKYISGIMYGFSVGLTFWLGNWAIGAFMGAKLNWKANPKKANLISLLLFFGFGIIASLSVPLVYRWLFLGLNDNWLNSILMSGFINLSVDVIFVSFYYSGYLVQYYIQSKMNEEELKRENLITRYEALKSQVNPHFLFNSLNTLTGIVEQSPEKAVEFIKKLSDIYRYVLDQRDKELVPIEEEIKFVDDFMYLAKARYGDGIKLTYTGKFENCHIAPLGLQILIENAIKHNIISDDEPLNIDLSIEDNYLVVRNNLQKKLATGDNTSIGLDNLKNRYSYFTKIPVEVIEDEHYFIVKIPLLDKPTA